MDELILYAPKLKLSEDILLFAVGNCNKKYFIPSPTPSVIAGIKVEHIMIYTGTNITTLPLNHYSEIDDLLLWYPCENYIWSIHKKSFNFTLHIKSYDKPFDITINIGTYLEYKDKITEIRFNLTGNDIQYIHNMVFSGKLKLTDQQSINNLNCYRMLQYPSQNNNNNIGIIGQDIIKDNLVIQSLNICVIFNTPLAEDFKSKLYVCKNIAVEILKSDEKYEKIFRHLSHGENEIIDFKGCKYTEMIDDFVDELC